MVRFDEAVIFDMACYAIGAPFFCRFDPYYTDPALQRRRSALVGRLVGRYPQHTNHEIAWDQRHWREALESGTAQVFGYSFDCVSGIYSEKAHRPVYMGPCTLPALRPARWQGPANFRPLNFCGELLEGLADHKATPAKALSVPSERALGLPKCAVSPMTCKKS